MAVNPCCMSLQRGVIILAIIDIFLAILDLILAILVVIAVTVWIQEEEKPDYVKIVIASVAILVAIVGLVLSILLYIGAKKREIHNGRVWLIIKVILFCLLCVILSLIVNSSDKAKNAAICGLAVIIIISFFRAYMIFAIYCFTQELRLEKSRVGFQARLEAGVDNTQQPTILVNTRSTKNSSP